MGARIGRIGCFIVAFGVAAFFCETASAHAITQRARLDGCDVGGDGNDIYSLQTRYLPAKDQVEVSLRLCDDARPDTTYRVFIDHTAPFVGDANATTGPCSNPADSVVMRGPKGHGGVGRSIVRGNVIRFFIPLQDLDVAAPGEVPSVHLWATSTRGRLVDQAPNNETGDACAHPRSHVETLTQPRVVLAHLVWVTQPVFEGFVDGISDADGACRMDAEGTGHSGTFVAWFSTGGISPSNSIFGNVGAFTRPDGTLVALGISDLENCTKGASGTDCLLAPIDRDIRGLPIATGTMTWTGTLANGTPTSGPTCNNWSSTSPSVSGSGGAVEELGTGWTDGSPGACNQLRSFICLQVLGEG